MSLDGFIAGPNERLDNGLGDGGQRLHEWTAERTGVNGQVIDEFMSTGAIVCGRGTIEPAGWWGGDHHDGVPIFVLSRREPGSEPWPLVTYVPDISDRDDRGQARRGRQGRAGARRRHRAARARRRRPGRDRDPPRPGAARPGAPALRRSRAGAHRARAHRASSRAPTPRTCATASGADFLKAGAVRPDTKGMFHTQPPQAASPPAASPLECPSCGTVVVNQDFCTCGEYLAWELTLASAATPAAAPAVAYLPPAPADLRASTLLTLRDPARDDDDPSAAVSVAVVPGAEVTVLATVRNQGQIVDTFDLRVDGLPDTWWTISPATVFLNPWGTSGDYEQEVQVRLHPPRDARGGGASLAVDGRRALALAPDADVAHAQATLTVQPFQSTVMSRRPGAPPRPQARQLRRRRRQPRQQPDGDRDRRQGLRGALPGRRRLPAHDGAGRRVRGRGRAGRRAAPADLRAPDRPSRSTSRTARPASSPTRRRSG